VALATLTGAQVIVEYKTEGQADRARTIEIRTRNRRPRCRHPSLTPLQDAAACFA
jgi:hypothetical protein